MAYAFSLSNSNLKKDLNIKLLSLAKYDKGRNRMHWGVGDSAESIEATSYALLNQILHNDMTKGNSIVNWLNAQQLQSGSFKSTQDTVIGLQALSEYSIRSQMPALNLVTNISSSNDIHFRKILSFHEENAHVLQHFKLNSLGGMLFVRTAGYGIGRLSVKLRYNVLKSKDEFCQFDLTVSATKIKEDEWNAMRSHKRNIPDKLSLELIKGVQRALKLNPRNRIQKRSFATNSMLYKATRSLRVKRQNGNAELTLQILVCAKNLGNKAAGMSIVDVGIFSGFVPNEDDLKDLQMDQGHLIDRYEKSSKGIVFYLRKIPSKEKYCFSFRVNREFIVGNTQRSVVKVYDYSEPEELCTVFYSPDSNSPLLRTLCEGRICQCAEGGCPQTNLFNETKDFQKLKNKEKEEMIMEMACEKYDFVWMGKLNKDIKSMNGFWNISFKIDEVVKEGIEGRGIEGDTKNFLARDNCESARMFPGQKYLIMGKDGQRYEGENGKLWYRYLLDKTNVVFLWTDQNRRLLKIFGKVLKKLKSDGCTS